MAIKTRETTAAGVTNKGSPLTNAELDNNFVELQQNKIELDDLSVGAESDPSGDGSIAYDNTTGVFTYTPPADISGAVTFAASAGEALAKGDVVYVSGISGNKPVVSKADADDASKMPAFGLAETAANLNANVNIITFGTIYDLDTSGFGAGDTVFVSTTAGALTNSAPTGESSLLQNMGKVMRSDASAGSIKVGGAGRTNATPNLNDGNVFIGNSSNQAEARALAAADVASGTFADARISESSVTQHQAALSVTESQISDLGAYITASSTATLTNKSGNISQWTNDSGYLTSFTETNDLTASVTWANVPDANITQSSVTQHEAALSVTASQLSDVTSTAAELNLVDGSTADTVVNSKAVIYGSAGQITANELDVDNIQIDANAVKSTNTNGNIQLFPNGTGFTELYGNTNAGAIRFNCELNSHGVTVKGPAHSAGATYSLELPDADGSNGQALVTDGSGKLSFGNVDALPSQSGNSGYYLTTDGSSASWDNLKASPTFTGTVTFSGTDAVTLPVGTTAQRPTAAQGMLRYNTTTSGFEGYSGSAWSSLGAQVEKGTQTKTYTSGESSTITLSSAITSGVPVVSVTKEVPQTGVTNNTWDVDSTAENYTRYNSAPATTLDWVLQGVDSATASGTYSFAAQTTNPEDVAISADGTQMYIINGLSSAVVYQYTLSTAYDVTSASYDSKSFSVNSQETSARAVRFSSDGTKMYVVGNAQDTVFQYTLSTAWDVTTASYASKSFSITSQSTGALGLFFSADGTKFYVCTYAGSNAVYQYNMSTAWDVSTASYSGNSFTVSQDIYPHALVFNSTGTRMYVAGDQTDKIYQYTLSTAWDLSTASYNSISLSSVVAPYGLAIGTDNYIYQMSRNGFVTRYTIPNPLALGTGSFASADVGKTIEANDGVFVLTATDGSYVETSAPTSYDQVASGSWEMYGVVYNTTDGDLELSGGLLNKGDISSAVYEKAFSVSGQGSTVIGLAFKPDGTEMFVTFDSNNDIVQYTLSTAWDISTASYTRYIGAGGQDSTPAGISFNNDGTKLFLIGFSNTTVYEYELSTAYNLSTASYERNFSLSSYTTQPYDIAFNADGSKMFITDNASTRVLQFSLSTPFNVTTAGTFVSFSIASQMAQAYGITFNSDGTTMYVSEVGDIFQYTLSTAYDISTASYASKTLNISGNVTTPTALVLKSDDNAIFVSDYSNTDVSEYSIGIEAIPSGYHAANTTASTDSTYWTDINSMTADEAAGDGNVYYAVSTDDRTTWKIAKSTDGERSIVRNNSGTWQYNSNAAYGSETWVNATTNAELPALQEAMSVAGDSPYDLANSTEVTFASDPGVGGTQAFILKNDGTRGYWISRTNDAVYQSDLPSAFTGSGGSWGSTTNFSIASQETNPSGLRFKSDGTKMYVTGYTTDAVYQYSLSTAWDVTTASYDSVSFSLSSQMSTPQHLAFSENGLYMYIVDGSTANVYQYNLSTAWDLSTASYSSNSLALTSPSGLSAVDVVDSGTKMFASFSGQIKEYSLSTAYDVSTASATSDSISSLGFTSKSIQILDNGGYMALNTDTAGYLQDINTQTVYVNQMDKTQLDAVSDANHFTLGDDLDLAIIFNMSSGTTVPSSDGVSINYDANALNQGAVLGTDYNWDFPATDKVRITSLAAQNLKVRIV